jgi:hypothetical protein
VDDWTTLCELLVEDRADALARFGFPARYGDVIEAFVAAVEAAATEPADLPHARRELLASILWRLNRLGATDAVRAASVADRLASVRREPELPETYPLRPVSPELREMLDARTTEPRSDKALVARVLRDL